MTTIDTLVVRSVLVPALTMDVGERTWWPARLWRERRAPRSAPASSSGV